MDYSEDEFFNDTKFFVLPKKQCHQGTEGPQKVQWKDQHIQDRKTVNDHS